VRPAGLGSKLASASHGGLVLSDVLQPPNDSRTNSPVSAPEAESPSPSKGDVGSASAEVEPATSNPAARTLPAGSSPVSGPRAEGSRAAGVILYLSLGFALIVLLGWSAQNVARRIRSWAAASTSNWNPGSRRQRGTVARGAGLSRQAEAESLLERLASGDSAAADQALSESDQWIGKTQRTPKATQLITTTLDQHDLHARDAALQATLALDGVPRDEAGLNRLEIAVANPNQRAWALWMLGALGNRGVQQDHIVQILSGFLDDGDARTRAGAVDGLGIVGSDETIAKLLDRFRNDPSPLVQESAARNLGDSGMYTHEQRMSAAASMVGWLDDALVSPQQKSWAAHVLRDISNQDFGLDAAAWQRWYSQAH
jgi:hypothetical protein